MDADSTVVRESDYTNLFAANYELWRDDAIAIITRYQEEMKDLNTVRIVSFGKAGSDTTVTCYEDGTKVYVNFGNTDFTINGIVIPARDYAVERSGNK